MANILTIDTSLFVVLILQISLHVGYSQTYCSYRVQVPDLDICDASGGIEENINSDVYETKGNINGMQDYQNDNFKLLDEQISTIVKERDQVETGILDITEEINTVKRALGSIGGMQALLNASSNHRGKRATTSTTQLMNDLDAAKLAFQQSVINLEGKLRNLAKQVEDNEKQNKAIDAIYTAELASNQQKISDADTQLTAIINIVQQNAAAFSGTGSAPVVGASTINQDVANLVADGKIAEQVEERQIDNLEKEVQTIQALENQVSSDIQTATSALNTTSPRIDNAIRDALTLTTTERRFGDEVGEYMTNNTMRMGVVTNQLTQANSDLAQVGSEVLQLIMNQTSFTGDLTSFRKQVDTVQSLVTFSERLSLNQTTDILNLRKTLTDNINVMRYAFGATTTPP